MHAGIGLFWQFAPGWHLQCFGQRCGPGSTGQRDSFCGASGLGRGSNTGQLTLVKKSARVL
jgi:hypothetical protein